MALQVQIVRVTAIGDQIRVAFNLVAAGNYVAGGDIVDFTKATTDPTFFGNAPYVPSSQGPVNFDVWDAGGNLANGVFPVMGSSQSNSKVKFTSAFNTELVAGAYPAAIIGAKLQGEATFTPNQ